MRQSQASCAFAPYGGGVEMRADEPFFWMGGRLAYGLLEVNADPRSLDLPGFWAISTTFEGMWTCARFAHVIDAPLPPAFVPWGKIESKWESSLTKNRYMEYVESIREQISQGWVYQVNACRVLSVGLDQEISLLGLMHQILDKNPAPYLSFLKLPELEIASASPELLLSRREGIVTSGPIKGTKNLGSGEFGSKDKAENVMIVDLIRNDLGKICQPGSVNVPRLLATEDHPGLSHLVSDVSGRLLEDIGWEAIGGALLPPGSVSGAPKFAAVKTIEKAEPIERGPYCGALGWVSGQSALLSVAIRIFWKQNDGLLRFGTGAGITWSSDAQEEWDETQLKAARLISIAGGLPT